MREHWLIVVISIAVLCGLIVYRVVPRRGPDWHPQTDKDIPFCYISYKRLQFRAGHTIYFVWEPRDVWVGIYIEHPWWEMGRRYYGFYLCLVPFIPLHIVICRKVRHR